MPSQARFSRQNLTYGVSLCIAWMLKERFLLVVERIITGLRMIFPERVFATPSENFDEQVKSYVKKVWNGYIVGIYQECLGVFHNFTFCSYACSQTGPN